MDLLIKAVSNITVTDCTCSEVAIENEDFVVQEEGGSGVVLCSVSKEA